MLGLLLQGTPGVWAQAEGVSGVTFYASFDHWLLADQAVGRRSPVRAFGGKLAPGKVGQALDLDGNSYLEFSPVGNVAEGKGTVALWFQPRDWGAKTYDNFFGLSDTDTNAVEFERANPSGNFRLNLGGPGTPHSRALIAPVVPRNGQWYHCAATWDTATQKGEFYVDGKLAAALTAPGPLPGKVPTLLIGAGWGRMGRAVNGLVDEVVILDHAATADEVQALMKGSPAGKQAVRLTGDGLQTVIQPEAGTVTLGAMVPTGSLVIGPLAPYVRLGDREVRFPQLAASRATKPIAGALGAAQVKSFTARDEATGLTLRLHAQALTDRAQALVWCEVTNDSPAPVRVTEIGLRGSGDETVVLPGPRERLRVFTDNGGLCGSGSHDLCQPSATHEAHGALVMTDPQGDWGASLSFASFRVATVTNRVRTDQTGQPVEVLASAAYPNGYGLAPGAKLTSEVVEISCHPGGHPALEHWADTVMAVNELSPPKHCMSGWNSWYAYRLTISEDIVLANARIIKQYFAPLGATNVQIDHGWQYRDIIGHWVPNDRFPHGLPWLSGQLKQLGLSLGLWTAVTSVSEYAPEATEHPEMLAQDASGKPFVSWDNWYWEPHGATLAVDPTSPAGAAYYRDAGAKMKSYGCVYLKNDFQAHLAGGGMKLRDSELTLGAPVWREFTRLLREGMGPDMAYMACNAPLNLVAGLCDAAWVHRDIGNPAGSWEHLRGFANDFATRYHVSGKFYWSDPDYVQIGQGDLNENRIRLAWCALGGGPAFLGDRLPDLPKEKLLLLTKCFPSYRQCARPLDLFSRDGYARVWDLPVKTTWGAWHVMGLFNLDEEDARIGLSLADLGLADGKPVVVWDFYHEQLLGEMAADRSLGLNLQVPVPRTSCRLLRVTPKQDRPFVLSTDLHLTQGGVELPQVKWDAKTLTLSGTARRAPGLKGKVFVYVPEGYAPLKGTVQGKVLAVPVSFKGMDEKWTVAFRRR